MRARSSLIRDAPPLCGLSWLGKGGASGRTCPGQFASRSDSEVYEASCLASSDDLRGRHESELVLGDLLDP
jgi:hypothetical protein